MYRYLDRRIDQLGSPQAFLVGAMRVWVGTSMAGRCPCAALRAPFAAKGAVHVLQDFGMAMAALNVDGLATLHFGANGAEIVSDDEAVLLGLFDAAGTPDSAAIYRRAAALVTDDAVFCLTQAVKHVAVALSCAAGGPE